VHYTEIFLLVNPCIYLLHVLGIFRSSTYWCSCQDLCCASCRARRLDSKGYYISPHTRANSCRISCCNPWPASKVIHRLCTSCPQKATGGGGQRVSSVVVPT